MSKEPSLATIDEGFCLRLPGGPEAAATARRALSQLHTTVDGALMDTMRLLITELVANSVRHAEARFVSVQAELSGQSVWLEVADEGPGFEITSAMRQAAQSDDSGWGLYLVERLSNRWGVRREDGATRVWFELAR